MSRGLMLRAAFAFLALPGIAAFAVPLLWFRPTSVRAPWMLAGAPVLLLGCVILGWCVRDFFVRGRGTLAPWDPPRALVRGGLYRYTRNPMYIGVLSIVGGWAIGFRSWALAGYAIALAVGFHLRVLLHEEPWLARTFVTEWPEYRRRVPRWLL